MFKKTISILLLGLCALAMAQNWHFYEGPWCAKNFVDIAAGMVSGSPVIYGVNQDYSLAKSTDEGQSWTVLLEDVEIRCVTCNPVNADLVYIGLQSIDGGIMYSTNGGTNWAEINSGLPGTFVPSAIAMRDAQHIVLGLDPLNADDQSIYYWDINQWTPANTYGKTGFRVTDLKWDPRATNEEVIYASSDKSLSDPDYIGVYKSEDYGHTWSQIGHPDPGQPQGYMIRPEAISICCDLNGYIYAGYTTPVGYCHRCRISPVPIDTPGGGHFYVTLWTGCH